MTQSTEWQQPRLPLPLRTDLGADIFRSDDHKHFASVTGARAASMVAFSADKLVYSAISLISSTISPMSFADSERLSTLSFAPCVLCAASSATLAEYSTNCVIPQSTH